MQAVVLVGGFGTRLRPLTLSTPKQLLPVGNRPMLERVVEHLARHGVDRAVLSLGYRPDAFRDAYPDGTCAGVELHYAVEPEPRDTAGAIRFAADHAGISERFLVVNGDVLTDLDVTDLIARHDAAGAEATLALHRVEDPSAFGVVPTRPDGRVLAFIEKPPRDEAPTNLINAGTYVLEPTVVDRIEPDVPVNVERVTFPAIAADGALYAFDGDTYWIDAGTPASLLQANLDLLSDRRGDPEEGIHPEARVEGKVSTSWLGPGAVVREGAEVQGSLLLPGATVARGAVVRDAIVGPRATIGEGATVDEGSVVGDDVQVGPGDELHGTRVPAPVP
ncbi:MAG TPA: NDP-sugar synthase [Acidimicrobiales bacterium]|nr:NDP-sugar synthase [Acidimicrobiales bacterium]